MGSLTWLFLFLLCFSQYQLAFSSSSLSFLSSSAHSLCRRDQRSALLQFKHMFTINSNASWRCELRAGIPSYPKTLTWDENATDCCNWDGVTCDGLTGHVIGLDLSCSQLFGKIHPNSSLPRLSHLQRLNLAYNDFNGSRISYVFGSFARLTHLNLSNSALSGSIPSEISHLSKLISLDLSLLLSLGDYYRLRLEPLNFKILLKNMTRLQELDLFGVNISSGLPDSIGYLKSLNYLSVGGCELRGSIPKSLGNLTLIRELFFSTNGFHGEVPSTLSNLNQLTQLDLSANNFEGKIPNLAELTNLGRLSLAFNNFIGGFPLWVANLKPLSFLDITGNQLTGPIPFNLSSLQNLQYFYLWSNSLSGVIPPSLFSLPSLLYLDWGSNKLTGQIPSLICNASSLEILDLSHNNLSGAVPLCLGNFSVLSVLNLRSNGFTGTIPLAFAKPNLLRSLDLSGNLFEGPLPRSLANCKSLEVLNVGNNKIDDTFPNWLETLPELQVLVVRSNRFHGPINSSKSKFSFPKLRVVDLSYNEFTGHLPARYFEHFQAMKNKTMSGKQYMSQNYYHDSVVVTIKGHEIEMRRILTIFTTIDFSSNNFSGEIPNIVGKLNSLILLNFSHNSLIGNIPASLGNLTNLESLDMSFNQLTGEIPSQLASLTFLAVLNLSWNRLHGPIPMGKQFATFENGSYAGNLGLCGFPLSNECQDNPTKVQPPVLQHEEDDSNFDGFFWKVVVIGYGCGMTLGLFLGSLMFLIGRPRFFVKLAERKLPKKVIRLRRTVVDTVARRN